METLKFKTTINCGACVAKVTPILNEQENVKNWSVDTGNADKILTVEGENIDEAELVQSLSRIGYKAEKM
ncbi:heavy-metal-associated domain-containing protein [Nubsella zeaxanthinifaciens]|uniref:heavy-metal-associated domain-containing protein n=1 Tax=Nubsella zeaxanthinifaciens TaxID=392412 RepID=UPI003D065220